MLLKGKTVKDLTKADFEVYENDVRQEADQLLAQLRGLAGGRVSLAPMMIRFFENYQRIKMKSTSR